jgi:hypothetical protein
MAEKDIIQNMISRLGQSQDDRLAPEIDAHFVDVDERTGADLLAQTRALAAKLRFYRHSPDFSSENWSAFFPDGADPQALAALLSSVDGQAAPHLGLLGAFLALYSYPQRIINEFTGRHLDFQMQRVLRFTPRPPQADHAHLLFELKKGAAPTAITPALRLTAGKDAHGVELIYQPVREVVVGQGKVAALHSVFHNDKGIFFAPLANSGDGLGAALSDGKSAAQPGWRPFGGADLPPAQIGFALASPVLRMQEGQRTVNINLCLNHLDAGKHTSATLAAAFEAHITGPKGWQGPFPLSATLSVDRLALSFSLPASSPAVVDYDPKLHGQAFAAQSPVLQLLLKPDAGLRYDDLSALCLSSASIKVEVQTLQAVSLENDNGSLNPKKAFLPFGAQPVVGSRFMIGCDEALAKNLLDLKVKLAWQGAPANLATWYTGYANVARMQDGVSCNLVYQDRSGQVKSTVLDLMARDSSGVSTLSPNAPPPSPLLWENKYDSRLYAFFSGGSLISRLMGRRLAMKRPLYQREHDLVPAPTARSGFITISLSEDFLHGDYRHESIQHAVNQDKIVLNEPYTPKVQAISIDYQAQSDEVDISANAEDSFTNFDLQFFHVGCFGQMREHAYLRSQYAFVADKRVTLLPGYASEGELLIGISAVAAGDSLSLLMQVAEGSANPDLPAQKLSWSVLCDNYWRDLTPQELALDTSNDLRASGILAMTLPQETSTENSWLPGGYVWLRASVPGNSAAVCRLISVAANAVEVQFIDQGNDPAHLAQPLAAKSIAKLKTPQAAVKGVDQPYASFGGSQQETSAMLTRRAAERLRHRNRCITPWDYERMLLEAFPRAHKVKCIPHACGKSWLAPGHVMLVVIPDLRNQNAVDPLQPHADIDTLTRMKDFAQQHCGMQVKLKVKNPLYLGVQLDFKVRLRSGFAFNYYSQQLQETLIRTLSPWAFDASRSIEFGGRIYRSVLLDVVEELPYVDYVTDFKMGLATSDGTPLKDVAELSADTPDAILVSAPVHTIAEA